MFQKLKELLGLDPIKNQSDAYTRRVADINTLESEYEKLSDEALAAATAASDGSAPVTAGEMLIPGIIWIVIGIAAVVLLELAGKASRKYHNSN